MKPSHSVILLNNKLYFGLTLHVLQGIYMHVDHIQLALIIKGRFCQVIPPPLTNVAFNSCCTPM